MGKKLNDLTGHPWTPRFSLETLSWWQRLLLWFVQRSIESDGNAVIGHPLNRAVRVRLLQLSYILRELANAIDVLLNLNPSADSQE